MLRMCMGVILPCYRHGRSIHAYTGGPSTLLSLFHPLTHGHHLAPAGSNHTRGNLRTMTELIRLTDFVEDMQQAGQHPSSRVLAFVHEPAGPAIAKALRIASGTEVVRVDRLRLAEGRPMAYDTTWLPLRYGDLLVGMDLTQETIYHILEMRYAIPVLSGAFYITAAEATAPQAGHLEVAPGSALLVIQRISYTTGDVPVYIQERYYRPDRVQYRVMLRRQNDEAGGSKIDEFRAAFAE